MWPFIVMWCCGCREVNRHSSLKKIVQHLMLKGWVLLLLYWPCTYETGTVIGHVLPCLTYQSVHEEGPVHRVVPVVELMKLIWPPVTTWRQALFNNVVTFITAACAKPGWLDLVLICTNANDVIQHLSVCQLFCVCHPTDVVCCAWCIVSALRSS